MNIFFIVLIFVTIQDIIITILYYRKEDFANSIFATFVINIMETIVVLLVYGVSIMITMMVTPCG